MNVRDLKKILDKYPDDLPVLIPGYESGVNDLNNPRGVYIEPDYYWTRYSMTDTSCNIFGRHRELMFTGDSDSGIAVQALLMDWNPNL
jgi:hypothetical protein